MEAVKVKGESDISTKEQVQEEPSRGKEAVPVDDLSLNYGIPQELDLAVRAATDQGESIADIIKSQESSEKEIQGLRSQVARAGVVT